MKQMINKEKFSIQRPESAPPTQNRETKQNTLPVIESDNNGRSNNEYNNQVGLEKARNEINEMAAGNRPGSGTPKNTKFEIDQAAELMTTQEAENIANNPARHPYANVAAAKEALARKSGRKKSWLNKLKDRMAGIKD